MCRFVTICSLLISIFGCSCASHSRERAGAKPQGRLVELRFTSSGMAAEPYEQFCFTEADDDILPELDSLIRRHRLWRCYSHYYSRYIQDGDSHALNAIYEHPDGTRQTIHLSCSGSMPKPLRALVEHLRTNYAPVAPDCTIRMVQGRE